MTPIGSGWGWPERAKKPHWFEKDGRSLCNQWLYFGRLHEDGYFAADACKACERKLAEKRGAGT